MFSSHRPIRVALLVDGMLGVSGVAEIFRSVRGQFPSHVEAFVLACRTGRGVDVVLPGRRWTQLAAPITPEIDFVTPSTRRVMEALRDREVDVVHAVGPGPLGWPASRAAEKLGIPLVAGFHTDIVDYTRFWPASRVTAPTLLRLTRAFYGRASMVVAPTRSAAARLAVMLRRSVDEIFVVPQGIDARRFRPALLEGPTPAVPTILTVARLSPEKGIDHLLQASRQVRHTHRLRVVGRGPSERRLRRQAPAKCSFDGVLRGRQLVDAYRQASLFVLPSITETCGQVVLEAQASGLACIVPAQGSSCEAIEDGHTGLICASNEAADLASAMSLALADPSLRYRLGRAARRHVLTRSWKDSAAALAAAWCDAATGRVWTCREGS